MSTTEKVAKPTRQTILDQLIAERRELVELCRSLTPEEWDKASLCIGWRVRDVVAHIVGSQSDLLLYFTSGGLDKANQKMADNRKALTTQALTSELEKAIRPIWITKLAPTLFLYDNWVHQQDIRWVLGPERQRRQDPERMRLVLGTLQKVALKRYAGTQFVATDLDWQIGEGLKLSGPAEAIAMALAHRPAALSQLEGPGATALAERWKKLA